MLLNMTKNHFIKRRGEILEKNYREYQIKKHEILKNFIGYNAIKFMEKNKIKMGYSDTLNLSLSISEIDSFYENRKDFNSVIINKLVNFFNGIKSGQLKLPFLNNIEIIISDFLKKCRFNKILVIFSTKEQMRNFVNNFKLTISSYFQVKKENNYIFKYFGKDYNICLEDSYDMNEDYDFIIFLANRNINCQKINCSKLYINSRCIVEEIANYNFDDMISQKIISDYHVSICIDKNDNSDFFTNINSIVENIDYKNLLIICDNKKGAEILINGFNSKGVNAKIINNVETEYKNIYIYFDNRVKIFDQNFDSILITTNKKPIDLIKYYFLQLLITSEKVGKIYFDRKILKNGDFFRELSLLSKSFMDNFYEKVEFVCNENFNFSNLLYEFKKISFLTNLEKLIRYSNHSNMDVRYPIFPINYKEENMFNYIFNKFISLMLKKMEKIEISLQEFRLIISSDFLKEIFSKNDIFLTKLIVLLDFEKNANHQQIINYKGLNIADFLEQCEKLSNNELEPFLNLSKYLFKKSSNSLDLQEINLIIEYEKNISDVISKGVIWRGKDLNFTLYKIKELYLKNALSYQSKKKFESSKSFKLWK